MIDIHTHILPGVDDGSPNMETSVKLIEYEIQQGVTDIFVTPHFFRFREFMSSTEENQRIFENLKNELKSRKIKANIYLGNEIYYDKDTMKNLKNGTVCCLGDSKYVLVEFSLYEETEDIGEAINNLMAKGYKPIIAHPERYPYLNHSHDFGIIRRMGAMIQINSGSILGDYGRKIKKCVMKLIKEGLVDFVASDIHEFRPGRIKEAFKAVKKAFSDEIAMKLFDNRVVFE